MRVPVRLFIATALIIFRIGLWIFAGYMLEAARHVHRPSLGIIYIGSIISIVAEVLALFNKLHKTVPMIGHP